MAGRVRTNRPGWITLELVRRDALAAIIPAFPTPAAADLRALPIGGGRTAPSGTSGYMAPTS